MGRSPCCEKVGLKRGPWTSAEDRRLIHYVQTHGEGGWRALPKAAGLLRCGKSCRLRWFNYLRPDLKRGNISEEEEKLIIKLHSLLGNRWALIASRLPGRTDNEIKNHWNAHIKKRLRAIGIDPETHRPMQLIMSSSKLGEPATSEMGGATHFSCMKLMDMSKRGGSYNYNPSMQAGGAGSMKRIMQTCRSTDESMQSVTKRELGWKGVDRCMELGMERVDYGMQLGLKEGDNGIQLVGIKGGGSDYCMQLAESRDESKATVELVRYCERREVVIGQEVGENCCGLMESSMVHYKRANTMKHNYEYNASEVPTTLNSYTAMPGFAKDLANGRPHVYTPMPNIITTNDNILTLQDSPPPHPGTPLVPQENFLVPSRTSSDIGGDAKADQGDHYPTKFCDYKHPLTQCYKSNSHAHEGEYHDNSNNFDIQSVLMSLNIDQEDATNTWNALEGDFNSWDQQQAGLQVHANNMDHENSVPTLGSPLAGDSTLLWSTFEDNMLVCTRPSSPPWLDFLCS